MSTYIIAIGGTGARLVEAIIHLAAAGVFIFEDPTLRQEDLHIFFIDPDSRNGNAIARTETLDCYQECHRTVRDVSDGSDQKPLLWMQTSVKDFASWSPRQRGRTLGDIFSRPDLRPSTRSLLDVLYTTREQDMDLREGFRGRPAVGSGVMGRLIQDERRWQDLVRNVQEEDKVFLCGSIFGGTGASGFPTLGRLLARDLRKRRNLRNVKLGGLLMLPYFSFEPPTEDGEINTHPDDFILRTHAALRYYETHALGLDILYLLGGTPSSTRVQGRHNSGGKDQRNPPHFLELYGALALRNFVSTEPRGRSDSLEVAHISRQSEDSLSWRDIPELQVQNRLKYATRFAFAWLSAISPDLEYAKRNPKDVRYALGFFDPKQLRELSDTEERNITVIKSWCTSYLKWLLELHQFGTDQVGWFNCRTFGSLDNDGEPVLNLKDRNQFTNLIPNEDTNLYLNHILDGLCPSPEHRGVVGLAKSLYATISSRSPT